MHCITTKVTATVTEVGMVFDTTRRKLVDLRRDKIDWTLSELPHRRDCLSD